MRSLAVLVVITGCVVGDDAALDPELAETTAELGDCPAPPSGLYAKAFSSWNMKLWWDDNSNNETGFRFERSDNGGAWFVLFEIDANRETTTDGFYSSGSSFRYRVRAFNNLCTSTPSAVAVVPRSPASLTGQYLGGGELRLAWSDRSSNETYFTVQRKLNAGAWYDAADVDDPTATLDLSPGTNRFRVRAGSNTGESWYTNEVSRVY